MKLKYIILSGLLTVVASSCDEFLEEPKPVDLISDEIVIEDEATAEQTVLGIYNSLQSANLYGDLLIGATGLLSDELDHTGSFPTLAQMDDNAMISDNVDVRDLWEIMYRGIYISNAVVERIDAVDMSEELKNSLVGEARFCRALLHFQLANLYGAVPLATTTELAVLRALDRTDVTSVYNFAIDELTASAQLLAGVDYGEAGRDEADRFRANEWAAKALLARVLLYAGQTSQAGQVANDVIENGGYSLSDNYGDNFLPDGNSGEIIFKIFASANDGNSLAFQFKTDGRYEYGPTAQIISAYAAEDERKNQLETLSDGRIQVIKYKDTGTGTDKPVVLRLAEMYLIRAEANIGNAQADTDITAIRARAGITTPAVGVTSNDILLERFKELAFEGHRWFDLKRTGQVDAVMSALNPSTWSSSDALLPIPIDEIRRNPTLAGKQNPDY